MSCAVDETKYFIFEIIVLNLWGAVKWHPYEADCYFCVTLSQKNPT